MAIVILNLLSFFSALTLFWVLCFNQKRVQTVYLLISIAATFQCFGNFLTTVAKNNDMAYLATLFIYVGGCFAPYYIFIILSYLCEIKSPKWIRHGLGIYLIFIMVLVVSINFCPIYYKSFNVAHANGFNYIERVYGPLHWLFYVHISFYFILITYLLIYSLKHPKSVSQRITLPLSILTLVVFIAYIICEIFTLRVNIVSVFYLVAMIYLIRLSNIISSFDLGTNIVKCIEKNKEYGYIEFDKNYRCVGYSQSIENIFPEILNIWGKDNLITKDDSFLYNEVYLWLRSNNKSNNVKVVKVNRKYYELHLYEIPKRTKGYAGYIIEIANRTVENYYMKAIENFNSDLQKEVDKKTQHITQMKDSIVLGMASLVESRDNSTGGHIKRTSEVMNVFSQYLLQHEKELHLNESFLTKVIKAAPMHDLGKIAVPDSILCKKGLYTKDEYDQMKKHASSGAKIVREILTGVEDEDFIQVASNVAHYHHERWNGEGYPKGLTDYDIPVEARLMALVDVFDALVSERCYKEAYTFDKAFQIIEEGLGEQFDPVFGKYFIECRPKLEELYNKWNNTDFNRFKCEK